MSIHNYKIAEIFYKIADLLEIEGANVFRVRAYREAGHTIEGYPKRINKMVKSGEPLENIPGIGKDLAKKIIEVVETGNLQFYEKLRSRTPESLLKLLNISGLGPKRVKQLYEELDITNIEELRSGLLSGDLAELDGFGEKTVKKLLEGLKSASLQDERTRFDIAEKLTDSLTGFLKEIKTVQKVTVAGSYRRRKETVGDLDIIAVSNEGKFVSEAFASYDTVDEVLSKGETKASIKLTSGLQVDLRIVANESYGAALLYFTGAKEHNIHLRKIASDNRFNVNEYGVFKEDQYILGQHEEDIYTHFDMAYIEPELRKDTGEIEAALNKTLPKLVSLKDIRGDLQMHTVKSDGEQTLSEMAQAAEEIGYEYIAITDHTSYIGVTQGLSEENISDYLQEIEDFNSQNHGVHILKGIEVDIYEDGRLDLPNEALKEMDIVLGSVHSHFNLSKTEQTKRLIRAMDNPHFNILVHPTTRRIGSRDPIALDIERIMKAALERECYLEINANPERLDIWDRHIRLAGDLGLKLAISTDAHRQTGLSNMKFGVFQARRGWAEKSQILNTRSLSELFSLLKRT